MDSNARLTLAEENSSLRGEKILVPPLKCQGIKTKLIPFIRANVSPDPHGRWIEPFAGTCAVALNLRPEHALLADRNGHIIDFYRGIQDGTVTPQSVREVLTERGEILKKEGADYYRAVRSEFNNTGDPVLFLFLNRADFNGMIRFNSAGQFNVPFCQKPERFSPAYISKICNQISRAAGVIKGRDWEFRACGWEESLASAVKGDFVYLDPPYIGRDTSYLGEWPEKDAEALAAAAHASEADICLSMWKENEFRQNAYLWDFWSDFSWEEHSHFYNIGAKESNRHPMTEVLAFRYAADRKNI